MFCRNCGTQMSDDAKFCANCGTSITVMNEKKVIEDNNIKFQLKPKFNVLYKLLTNIGYAVFLVFIFGFMFGLYELLFIYPQIKKIALGFIVVYVIWKMIFEKLQYKDLEYNFYATKVEYKDGFFNKEEKELKYKYIREVTMSQSLFERFFHIGTIKIFTNASSGVNSGNNHSGMNGRNGIYIHCVENVQEQYKIIKEIIDEGVQD